MSSCGTGRGRGPISFKVMKRFAANLIIETILILALSASAGSPRLAIGTLGMKDTKREAELADLVVARMTAAPEFELVERRELDAALKEASLGISGVVRARDAARVGALLRADRFVLGSSAPINGTNRVFIRLVNARTGVIEAIGVFQDTGSVGSLADDIANFVRAESKHPAQGHRDYLAIGVVQNLGVNNRFADFPAQIRGGVAAQLNRKVTVLERDVVSFLANEVRLDMGGLTERTGEQSPPMQFGFWIVDGFYQSYEAAEPEVQLKLRVERVQGGQQNFMLQGKPNDAFLTKVCETIVQALNQPVQASHGPTPTRQGEIAALEARGKQLVDYQRPGAASDPGSRIQIRSAHNPDKVMSALEEATRVFESMLLLEPENNAVKMRLAACLQFRAQNWGGVARDHEQERIQRAREYYREVISNGDAENANDARIALAESVGGPEGVEMLYTFAEETPDTKEKARLRFHCHEMLHFLRQELPLEILMPHVRKQLIEELTDASENPKDPVKVDFGNAIFPWRNYPDPSQKILRTLLAEMIEKFPNLKPYLLLEAVGLQTNTNSPISVQFLTSLKECEEHPEAVWHAKSYFTRLSSTLEDEKAVGQFGGYTLYQRMFESRQYSLVVAVALARQRAAEKGLAPPLTAIGKMRLAESYMALNQWKEALAIFQELPDASPLVKNECRRHLGIAAESAELADSAWKDKSDMDKVKVAYECIGRGQWATAASVMESIGHRTVQMQYGGPWGYAFTPVLPALVADECRLKAGKPVIKDPLRFELGESPYVGFSPEGSRHFAFEMEAEDLWMATYSQIKAFRGDGPFAASKPSELHEFERTSKTETASIAVTRNYIWAGTFDDGLLELDRRSGVCRRLTTNDGLFLNGISHLRLQGQTLWIAYRNGDNGAVGTLELPSRKFSALMPNLSPAAGANSQPYYNQALLDDPRQAPHLPIACMTDTGAGEMWFIANKKGLLRFRISDGDWNTAGLPVRDACFHDMTADVPHGLVLMANREYDSLSGEKSVSGGLLIYDYRHNKYGRMLIREGLPSNDISAVAVDGRIAWVGGRGFVAVVDVQEQKVLRIAYVSASRVYGIRLSPPHAWVALSCDKEGHPDYCGNARTGVYRLDRTAIEPQSYTANR